MSEAPLWALWRQQPGLSPEVAWPDLWLRKIAVKPSPEGHEKIGLETKALLRRLH